MPNIVALSVGIFQAQELLAGKKMELETRKLLVGVNVMASEVDGDV